MFATAVVAGNLLISAIMVLSAVWLVKIGDVDAFENFGFPAAGLSLLLNDERRGMVH